MQLEKATSSSSEAGLAGWISSNDVTLFTMVLVVIIALFLHSNLIRGQQENEQLTDQNQSLSEDLTSTGEQLDQTAKERDTLDQQLQERERLLLQTKNLLSLTQQERDTLQADLLDSLQRIESMSETIAALTADKTSLEGQRAQLTTQKTTLEQDLANLARMKAALESDKADLTAEKQALQTQTMELTAQSTTLAKDKASLNERLAAVAAQLEQRVKQMQDLEKERDRLKQQADALDDIVATLESKLKTAGTDLVALKQAAEKQQTVAAARIDDLAAQVESENARAEDYLSRLRRAAELFRGLQADKSTLEKQVSGLSRELGDERQRFQQQLDQETRVNRELVGIRGDLRRVAVLFDASGSMKEKGTGSGDRWAEAQKIATTWLAHLDVDECVLIVFSSDVRTFPSDGTLVTVHGTDGEANRAELMAQLKSVEPDGWTNTLAALQAAYRYDGLDTILLFSDGAPTNPNSGRFDADVADQIYKLCQQHADIPINTIGLGNYFDKEMSTFLRTLARLTGGTFRGR